MMKPTDSWRPMLKELAMRRTTLAALWTVLISLVATVATAAELKTAGDWVATSPREEIRPHFASDAQGGPSHSGSLVIEADHREGLDGSWVRTVPIEGGKHYQFHCVRRTENVELPRRSALVRVL